MNLFAFSSLLSAVASFICASIVYSEDRKNAVHRVFALMCCIQGFSVFNQFMMQQATLEQTAVFWMRLSDIWSFVLALLLHFVLLVTGTRAAWVRPLVFGIYAIAAIVTVLSFHHDFTTPAVVLQPWGWARVMDMKDPAGLANMLWPSISGTAGLLWMARCHLKEKDRRTRHQLGYITLALFMPFLWASVTYGLPFLTGVSVPELTSTSLTIQAVIIVYAMRRFKLFVVSAASAVPNIIATMADGLFLLDGSNRIVTANKAACDMLGYGDGALCGKPFGTLFNTGEIDPDTFVGFMFAGDTSAQDFEMTTHAGAVVPVNLSLSPLRSDDGLVSGAVSLVRDVSDYRRNERQLRTAADRLERSNRELQEFLFAASHHLQEPLRKIRTLGSRLRADPALREGVQARDYLARMVRNAQWMQRLLDSLREYLALETDTAAVEFVDLRSLVYAASDSLQDTLGSVQAQLDVGTMPLIECRRSQIVLLLRHLLENAARFRRPDTRLRIRVSGRILTAAPGAMAVTADQGNMVCEITVEDNGMGFEDQYRERIFGVFQRLGTATGENPGAGIGLAVCRKIAERHGGAISARGEPGSGAVFTLVVPVKQ